MQRDRIARSPSTIEMWRQSLLPQYACTALDSNGSRESTTTP
jgi:hypothetical protein